MANRSLALIALVSLALGMPEVARAGGFEYSAAGTRALGRGGAFAARADDPMALGYNPAALAFLPSYQLMLGSHLAFYDSCVDRTGSYDESGEITRTSIIESRYGFADSSDPSNWASQPFQRVCRGGYPGPSPALVFTGRPIPEFGFGVGILAPSGVGNSEWGNPDGSIDVNGMNLPSPVRYALVSQSLLLFYPTIGFGVSPVEWFSFGASFQWGIALVDFVNHSSSGNGPEDPALDARAALSASDPFVPAVVVSAHFVPIDALDVMISARFSDAIKADGTLRVTTGTFGTGMLGSYRPEETTVPGIRLRAGQPWQFALAARYAERRTEHARRVRNLDQAQQVTNRVEDPMLHEVWDIELDVVYELNSQVGDFVVSLPDGAEAFVCEGDGAGSCTSRFPAGLPRRLPIPHGWRDQVSIRLGGDWNIVPGTFAARLGAHFETRGANAGYQIQDFLPLMRLGLHAGVTFRVERFDISFSYAHIFGIDHTVENPNFRLTAAQGVEGQCAGEPVYDSSRPVVARHCYPQGSGAIVNGGRYTAELNVISLQVSYHFQ
jgi:long-subunit fatty acid transport protein